MEERSRVNTPEPVEIPGRKDSGRGESLDGDNADESHVNSLKTETKYSIVKNSIQSAATPYDTAIGYESKEEKDDAENDKANKVEEINEEHIFVTKVGKEESDESQLELEENVALSTSDRAISTPASESSPRPSEEQEIDSDKMSTEGMFSGDEVDEQNLSITSATIENKSENNTTDQDSTESSRSSSASSSDDVTNTEVSVNGSTDSLRNKTPTIEGFKSSSHETLNVKLIENLAPKIVESSMTKNVEIDIKNENQSKDPQYFVNYSVEQTNLSEIREDGNFLIENEVRLVSSSIESDKNLDTEKNKDILEENDVENVRGKNDFEENDLKNNSEKSENESTEKSTDNGAQNFSESKENQNKETEKSRETSPQQTRKDSTELTRTNSAIHQSNMKVGNENSIPSEERKANEDNGNTLKEILQTNSPISSNEENQEHVLVNKQSEQTGENGDASERNNNDDKEIYKNDNIPQLTGKDDKEEDGLNSDGLQSNISKEISYSAPGKKETENEVAIEQNFIIGHLVGTSSENKCEVNDAGEDSKSLTLSEKTSSIIEESPKAFLNSLRDEKKEVTTAIPTTEELVAILPKHEEEEKSKSLTELEDTSCSTQESPKEKERTKSINIHVKNISVQLSGENLKENNTESSNNSEEQTKISTSEGKVTENSKLNKMSVETSELKIDGKKDKHSTSEENEKEERVMPDTALEETSILAHVTDQSKNLADNSVSDKERNDTPINSPTEDSDVNKLQTTAVSEYPKTNVPRNVDFEAVKETLEKEVPQVSKTLADVMEGSERTVSENETDNSATQSGFDDKPDTSASGGETAPTRPDSINIPSRTSSAHSSRPASARTISRRVSIEVLSDTASVNVNDFDDKDDDENISKTSEKTIKNEEDGKYQKQNLDFTREIKQLKVPKSVSEPTSPNIAPGGTIFATATKRRIPAHLKNVQSVIAKTFRENERYNEDSKVDESISSGENLRSPRKLKALDKRKLPRSKSVPRPPFNLFTPPTPANKRVPMNKIVLQPKHPKINLKHIKPKINTLENANYKPGGGQVKIAVKKLEWKAVSKTNASNGKYMEEKNEKQKATEKKKYNYSIGPGARRNAKYLNKRLAEKRSMYQRAWAAHPIPNGTAVDNGRTIKKGVEENDGTENIPARKDITEDDQSETNVAPSAPPAEDLRNLQIFGIISD